MNIPKFNAFQKVILCLGALAVALRCFFPVTAHFYTHTEKYFGAQYASRISFTETFFHCIGIVIVTAVLVYLVGVLAKLPRVLRVLIIALITAVSIIVIMIVLWFILLRV